MPVKPAAASRALRTPPWQASPEWSRFAIEPSWAAIRPPPGCPPARAPRAASRASRPRARAAAAAAAKTPTVPCGWNPARKWAIPTARPTLAPTSHPATNAVSSSRPSMAACSPTASDAPSAERAGVDHAAHVDVVELEGVRGGGVDERGLRARDARRRAPQRRLLGARPRRARPRSMSIHGQGRRRRARTRACRGPTAWRAPPSPPGCRRTEARWRTRRARRWRTGVAAGQPDPPRGRISAEDDGERGRTPGPRGGPCSVGCGGLVDRHLREAPGQLVEDDLPLEPGERGADAAVHAAAEGEVRVAAAG